VPIWETQWSVNATANLTNQWKVSADDDSTKIQPPTIAPTGGNQGTAVPYPGAWTWVLNYTPYIHRVGELLNLFPSLQGFNADAQVGRHLPIGTLQPVQLFEFS